MRLRKKLNKADEFYIDSHNGDTIDKIAQDIGAEVTAVDEYIKLMVESRTGEVKETPEPVASTDAPSETAAFKKLAKRDGAVVMTSAGSKAADDIEKTSPRAKLDPTKVIRCRK